MSNNPLTPTSSILSKPSNTSISLQLAKLHSTVQQLLQQNSRKLQYIIEHQDASFDFNLFEPSQPTKISQECRKELLLKQIDRMMDQEAKLDRKMEQVKIIQEQQSGDRNRVAKKEAKGNEAIRDMWNVYEKKKNSGPGNVASGGGDNVSVEQTSSEDKIDSLNALVAMTRKRVECMLINEKSSYSFKGERAKGTEALQTGAEKSSLGENQDYEVQKIQFQQSTQKFDQEKKIFEKTIISLEEQLESKSEKISDLEIELRRQRDQLKLKQNEIFRLKIQKADLAQLNLKIDREMSKLKKWKANLESMKTQNEEFALFIQPKGSLISEHTLLPYSMRSLEGLMEFLSEAQKEAEVDTKNPEKFDNEQDLGIQESSIPMLNLDFKVIDEIQVPGLNLNPKKPVEEKKLISKNNTDRPKPTPSLAHQAKLSKFLKSTEPPKYTKMQSTLDLTRIDSIHSVLVGEKSVSMLNTKDENMKKFIRKSQVLGIERTKFVNKSKGELSLRTNQSSNLTERVKKA